MLSKCVGYNIYMAQSASEIHRQQLEQAIAVQESLRGTVDDAIIDATIAALRNQLGEIEADLPMEQQRKMATILFVDVVNSTKMLGGLDPEENLAFLDNALKRMAAEVESFGGQVTRFMGDGFLAVFGLSQAKENDPEMAVRSGLKMLKTAGQVAGELDAKHHIPDFRVRVGINTGLIVAGGVTEADGTMMGSAINLAARLEKAALPNSVLISSYTYSHVQGIFDLKPAESIHAKGFADPIQVYRVLQAKPRAFRLMTRGVEGVETHMIGRDAELGTLKQEFDTVLNKRGCRFVTVIGEAGLGKSRLLDEFERWIDLHKTQVLLFKGRAMLESMDLPYAIIRDIFAFRFEIQDNASVLSVQGKLVDGFRGALGDIDDLELKAQFVGQLLGYDFSANPTIRSLLETPQEIRDRAFIHLTDYFQALTANEPVVIFLDDLHWADESSLDFLVHLSQELTTYPVLFITLTRPILFERQSSWASDEIHTKIHLLPLSREESSYLISEVLRKVQNIPGVLRDMIINRAEGNPFYLEELIKMLLEHGVIVKGEPRWKVNLDHLEETHIPSTLTGIIQARLEGLPLGERTILQQASVIGRVFWDASVEYVHQSVCEDEKQKSFEVADLLSAVQEREMIYARDTSAFSYAVEYMFKNAIMRDVIYESVLIRKRKQYHSHVANWLMAKAGEQAVNFSGLIAGHLEKAGRESEAVEYLKKAANAAVSNYAIDEALVFYSRALEHVPPGDDQNKFDVLLGLERGNYLKGNRESQKKILDNLQSAVNRLGDPAKQAEVHIRLAWYSFYTSDFPTQLEAARQAKDLASMIGADELRGRADIAEAWALMMTGNENEAVIHATEALELTRRTNMQLEEGNALNLLGMLSINIGDYFKAIKYVEGFIRIAREIGNRERELTGLVNISVAYTPLGNYQAAIKSLQDVLSICEETGDRVIESTARVNLGWAAQANGDWQLARTHLEIGIAMKVKFEHREAEAEGLLWLGDTWLGLEKPDKALPLLEQALEYRHELDQPHHVIEATAAIARACFAKGDSTNASKRVNEILTYLADGGSLDGTWEPLRIYWSCIQILKEQANSRYKKLLEEAYMFLQERASRISDEVSRKMYLTNVPWHRKIMELWKVEAG